MFLDHQTYEDLKALIGAEATVALAQRYGGMAIYFPAIKKDGPARICSPRNGLKNPDVRKAICALRREGSTGQEILKVITETFPGCERITRSALYRFFDSVRKGRMRVFGIDDTFREISE